MKKIVRIIIFALCFLPSLAFCYQYTMSVVTMFKDEAKWMKEWIEYNRLLGFEHFYMYNNDSTDNYEEVLEPYIKKELLN